MAERLDAIIRGQKLLTATKYRMLERTVIADVMKGSENKEELSSRTCSVTWMQI